MYGLLGIIHYIGNKHYLQIILEMHQETHQEIHCTNTLSYCTAETLIWVWWIIYRIMISCNVLYCKYFVWIMGKKDPQRKKFWKSVTKLCRQMRLLVCLDCHSYWKYDYLLLKQYCVNSWANLKKPTTPTFEKSFRGHLCCVLC